MGQTKWHPISPDPKLNQMIMNRVVAKQVIRAYGKGAHLYVLEQMLGESAGQQDNWRQVLVFIDELNKGESKCTD